MKRLWLLTTLVLSLGAATARAQSSPSIQLISAPPSGSCTQNLPDQQVIATGALYSCQNGTWGQITGGGGGGAPSGPAGGVLSGDYPNPSLVGSLNVKTYGAVCNWNGTAGTDDTAAFQAAANAANALYAANGAPVAVYVPYGCTLGTGSGQSTITVPAGVHWQGPGSIFVPAQSANPLFLAQSVSDVGWSGIQITMVSNLSACGPTQNNNACSAILWGANSAGTGTAYTRVNVTGNTIVNSGWGITILAQLGLDTLSEVHVDGNTVMESQVPITSYQYADGIHVGGAVTGVTISHNLVTGRGDAGIAVTTEDSSIVRPCSNVAITGNTLYEDRIGIDDSGCSSLQVTGNIVHADIVTSSSNPAFRSIYYNGLPTNVNVMGNNFENYQGSGTDVSAKYDCSGGCGNGTGTVYPFNSKFSGNKVFSMYVRGSGISFSDNTFEPNGTFELDWDTTNGNGSYNDAIGQNTWQGNGTFGNDSRSDVYGGSVLAPQAASGTITFTNPGELSAIPATYASIADTTLTSGDCVQAGTGGLLTTPGGPCGSGGGGVSAINTTATGAVAITGSGGTTVSTTGSTINISSTSSGGVSNANFMFVGDSITCGNESTSGCANLGPGAGTPVVIASSGYTASTTGTASSGSTALTVASATNIQNGELVVGAGIVPGTLITAITGTSITLSTATTAALSTTAVSFGNMDYPAQAMRRQALTGNSNTGINAGVSGWRSDQVLSAYTTIVHPYAPSVTGKPGYLFLQIGTNDIFQGIVPATTAANLTSYWETAKADGWTVIALTIPIGPWSGTQYGWWVSLNSYIRANGTQYDRLVDETQVLNNDFDGNLFYSDAIHPINPGYTILAQLAAAAIATGESVRPTPIGLPLAASNCFTTPGCLAANYFPNVQNGPIITTAFYDAAAGFQAMRFATTDYQDTAFGAGALLNATGSHSNSAFGHYTQGNMGAGYDNSSVGDEACNGVTTGNSNNCFGAFADVSAGAAVGRTQLGAGTNAADNTLQFQSFNFLDENGNAAFNTVKQVVGSSIASASTIAPLSGLTHITGTSAIATITPPTILENAAAFTGCLTLIADGAWTTTTAGNIEAAMTATANTKYDACYDGTKWFIGGATGGGSSAFSSLTSGTNTAMTAHVGSGATLDATGSGVINATEVAGVPGPYAAPGTSNAFSFYNTFALGIGTAQLGQVAANNFAGKCTMATTTTCTITIAYTPTTPMCFLTQQNGAPITATCAVTTGTITVTAISANTNTWAAMAVGDPN